MTGLYVLVSLALAASLASAALAVFIARRSAKAGGADQRDNFERLREDVAAIVKMENSMLTGAVNAQSQATRDNLARFDVFINAVNVRLEKLREDTDRAIAGLQKDNAEQLERVRQLVESKLAEVRAENARALAEVRKDNAEQLEKMRQTVDEKLSSTLERRFGESFKIVNSRLEEIGRTFAELQTLQSGVNDLNRIFKNVKTRGTWGEVALESLLSQVLTEEQYERQFNLSRTGSELVDIVIKLPGKGDGEVYLPVDAKFPVEDYQRLVEASDRADPEGVEAAGKAVERRIKQEAQSIRDKYIRPPKTTDFAIMYLPIEGLYAEVVKRRGLIEDLQNRCRVVVCGPTTLAALLNSLQMGFKSVAIEKRSTEIGKLLQTFIGDFDKFCLLLKQTSKKLEGVQSTISRADRRTEQIRKKLHKVQKYGGELEGDSIPLLDPAADVEFDDEPENDIEFDEE